MDNKETLNAFISLAAVVVLVFGLIVFLGNLALCRDSHKTEQLQELATLNQIDYKAISSYEILVVEERKKEINEYLDRCD